MFYEPMKYMKRPMKSRTTQPTRVEAKFTTFLVHDDFMVFLYIIILSKLANCYCMLWYINVLLST